MDKSDKSASMLLVKGRQLSLFIMSFITQVHVHEKKKPFTKKFFRAEDLAQLNLHETLEYNAHKQKSPNMQPMILKQLSSTFVWYSLLFTRGMVEYETHTSSLLHLLET